jgi:DNA-binding CsgD family transcriptional regulator
MRASQRAGLEPGCPPHSPAKAGIYQHSYGLDALRQKAALMGVPSSKDEQKMYELRITEGLTLRELADRYSISPERVRQLLYRYARQTTDQPVSTTAMSRAATAARRARDLERAQAQADELLGAWREGQQPEEIAKAFGLRCRSVAQVIRSQATAADRAARAYARTMARAKASQDRKRPPHSST